jgi:hypothetical protein
MSIVTAGAAAAVVLADVPDEPLPERIAITIAIIMITTSPTPIAVA